MFRLGFPRDISWDKKVSLSRDKNKFLVPLSLCPGTRAAAKILGQTPLSRDVPGKNHFLPPQKKPKTGKGRSKTDWLSRPVMSHGNILHIFQALGSFQAVFLFGYLENSLEMVILLGCFEIGQFKFFFCKCIHLPLEAKKVHLF